MGFAGCVWRATSGGRNAVECHVVGPYRRAAKALTADGSAEASVKSVPRPVVPRAAFAESLPSCRRRLLCEAL